ncbi:MAG: helix-turn-helix domain-containing protein [Verrucomicrobiota bacterium]|jgi:cytoskeleton protein RodZ|nr:helix-turn-helix domain-containing protein [Verrucomicrobiota bacterium]MDP7049625.1 helix-turn-helix domain-containing protein [Verrucomicrobiota bacterium]
MPSVGDQLRAAREEQGKSLEDIGEALKIRADHVLALEEGDFSKFDAPVFVRGFIRSYCRILHLDSAPMVVQLNQELGGTDALASDPALSPGKKGFVDRLTLFLTRVNWSIWLPLLVLILIASIVWTVVEAKEAKREQLESGNWIENLPAAVHKPSRVMLELKINDLPDAPVKPATTNTNSAAP